MQHKIHLQTAKSARLLQAGLIAGLLSAPVQASDLVFGLAQSFETGSFGTDTTTDIRTTTLKLTLIDDDWRAALKLPFVSVTGEESFVPTTRGSVRGNRVTTSSSETSASVTRSGMGDAQLSLTRTFLPAQADDFLLELSVAAKLSTADEAQALGSGANDYSLELYADRVIGAWIPRLIVGYQWTGDTSDTDYQDIAFVTLGANYQLSKVTTLGVNYNREQASIEGADDFKAVAIEWSAKMTRDTRLGVGWQRGLSDAAPDSALNLFVSSRF